MTDREKKQIAHLESKVAWLQRSLDDRERLMNRAKVMISEYEAMIEKTNYELEIKKYSFERVRNIIDRLHKRMECGETVELKKIVDDHDDTEASFTN